MRSSSAADSRKLLIFDTHPIQYRSPVFKALAKRHAAMKVYLFNSQFNAARWWFHEVGKTPKQDWGLRLDEGFSCEVLGLDRLSLRARWKALANVLLTEQPAAVALYGYYLPEHWMLRRLCSRLRIPLLFVGETFTPSRSRWRRWLKAPLLAYFFSKVAQFIAIGERNRDYYRRAGIPDGRIVLTRYCVDVDFFALPPPDHLSERARWRKEEGIEESSLVVLFVGRLFERKRPVDLLALERFLTPGLDVRVAIVGNGPLEEELRDLGGGRKRLRFLGFRNQAEARACYHGADVLIVPSEYETWGLVVNEAFASGLPAIVTETCGVAGDLVREGQTGFVIPVGAVDKAAALVERLEKDRDECARLGRNAKDKVFREYRPEQFAEAFLIALERVTQNRLAAAS